MLALRRVWILRVDGPSKGTGLKLCTLCNIHNAHYTRADPASLHFPRVVTFTVLQYWAIQIWYAALPHRPYLCHTVNMDACMHVHVRWMINMHVGMPCFRPYRGQRPTSDSDQACWISITLKVIIVCHFTSASIAWAK